jgi:hypothetical protein
MERFALPFVCESRLLRVSALRETIPAPDYLRRRVSAAAPFRSFPAKGQMLSFKRVGWCGVSILTFCRIEQAEVARLKIAVSETRNGHCAVSLCISVAHISTKKMGAYSIAVASEEFASDYALVIGSDSHRHWGELKNALGRAESAARVLQRDYGLRRPHYC